jgi:hypothetical protein
VPDPDNSRRNLEHDNDGFENYLRTFRPVTPQPVHLRKRETATRHSIAIAAWAATAVLALLVALLVLHHRSNPGRQAAITNIPLAIDRLPPGQPSTLGSSDSLLVKSPSFKAAIDALAAPTPSVENSPSAHSALAALSEFRESKEETKP